MAEAWALLKGIQFSRGMGFNRVYFESDSKKIVEAMIKKEEVGNMAGNVLNACRKELEALETWAI